MKAERDDYRAQLQRRETDFEQRTRSDHTDALLKFEKLEHTIRDACRKATEAANRKEEAAAELSYSIAAERIAFEGRLTDAAKEAAKAMAVKERMIARRDEKLADAADAASKLQTLLDAEHEVSADRLITIRKICGKLGGKPRKPRAEIEMEEMEPKAT